MGLIRRLAIASAALTSITAGVCYHTEVLNNPWCSSFRIVRFGRATNAVSWLRSSHPARLVVTLLWLGVLGGTGLQMVTEEVAVGDRCIQQYHCPG